MSVRHDHEHERTERKTSRLQPTNTTRVGTPVGPGKNNPRYTSAQTGKAVGGPTSSTTRRQTKTSLKRNGAFSETRCGHLETYMVVGAGSRNQEIHGELSNAVNKVEVEKSRIIKEIAQRNRTNHPGEDQPEEDQPGDRVHQDSSRISTLTKLMM